MKLFLFTTDLAFAKKAAQGGVYSAIVDWESKGKENRQNGHDLEINTDTVADVRRLKLQLTLPITVRINPLDTQTSTEVELALQAGADIIMLPMAKKANEVKAFLDIVRHRAKTLVQIETKELVADLAAFKQLDWDYAYIGLNDLMISRQGSYIWEAVSDGTVESTCQALAGREYGFGGVTVVDGGQPLSFKLLLSEYLRLGCEISFMRRTFKREVQGRDVAKEIQAINAFIAAAAAKSTKMLNLDHQSLMQQIISSYQRSILVMYSTHHPSAGHIACLKQIAPDYKIVLVKNEAEARQHAWSATIVIGHRYVSQILPNAASLKWVQTTAGGVDQLPLIELREKQIVLTRNTTSTLAIAHHATTLLTALLKKQVAPRYKTALIFGLGQIGQAIAQQIAGKYRVWAVKRQSDVTASAVCERVFSHDDWQDDMDKVDILFMCLPHTTKTKNILNEQLLSRLPAHALIINVGRGETIDEQSVLDMLRAHRLGGYATDVQGPYFLKTPPTNQDMRRLNLVLTSHLAAEYLDRGKDIEQYVEEQLTRYIANEPLMNIVDYEKQY